ncbi:MAG TPA: potassium channel protein [Dehalococcoidia bacterium]|nr:potassium channel protein [Dehalococcoidia bacterium]
MSTRQRLLTILYAVIIIICIGVIGYVLIEGWSFLDALYMTIITLSTVGFQEVRELSEGGMIFSMVLILFGIAALSYSLFTVGQYILEGNLATIWGRRRMKDKIAKLKNHVILCGYGLVGREVAKVFKDEGVPLVIIEQDPDALALAAEGEYLCIQGNANSDEILEEAGIRKARALVAALGTDAENVYVTLSARQMRADLFIVARASTTESEPKLLQAGANRTMSPYGIGGRRLAMLTLRPVVVDFVDTTLTSRRGELILENIKISPGSPVCGKEIKEGRQHSSGTTILAVKKRDGRLFTNPPADTLLEVDDELIVIGTREQLRSLEGAVEA